MQGRRARLQACSRCSPGRTIGPPAQPLPCQGTVASRDGARLKEPPRWPLALDRVRHVGDTLAVVVAETLDPASDAAERIAIDYEALPAVADTAAAAAPGAPLVWDAIPGNLSFHWAMGDESTTKSALAAAAHITRLWLANNRIAVA